MTQQNEESFLVICQPYLLPSDFEDRCEHHLQKFKGITELISPTSLFFPMLESPGIDLREDDVPVPKPSRRSSNADKDNQRARNRILRDVLRTHFDKEMGSKFQSPKGNPILSQEFSVDITSKEPGGKTHLQENLKPPR